MDQSTITGRHHMRPDFFGIGHTLELRDDAEPVDVRTPFDFDSQMTITKHGAPTIVIVCCGPGAPLPQVLTALRTVADMNALKNATTFFGPPCGFLGPDGIACQLPPRHLALLGEHLHAYADLDGLVRW